MSRYSHSHHNNHHSQSTVHRGRPVSQHEEALANNSFEHFLAASTLKTIFGTYRSICEHLHLKPNCIPYFYPKLKAHVNSWKAKPLWKKFDARVNQKCYNRGKSCPNTRVLIIGAGPCGLRSAIEAQLLGAKVVVVEKRDRMTRNNVLHLWPFVIEDLRALGAKKFFGKFCAGAIDHISIRQLQCILLKVALLLGVEIHTEVSFERLIEPNPGEKTGWRAEFKPTNHPVNQFEFDVIIGADGKRNTLQGFKRKEFRGKLAIAITANFINKRTEAEARVEEISGVAFIFNQKFFKDLYVDTGIDLENIVYYKDDTHYFVMTAKKQSLIDKGVIRQDLSDTAKLLAPENVDRDELMNYAREAAEFSTNYQMPDLEFAVNHYGQPDVAMFDFTSMYAAENASRITELHGYRLLAILVGDSLLEPFWPTGSGCARGFLSSMDAAWAIRSWETATPLQVIAERESIYRLLAQTTPENLNKDYKSYTLDPTTRYPNLNKNVLLPHQVTNLFDTDNPKSIEIRALPLGIVHGELPKKRRRRDSHVDPDTLLGWIQDQIKDYESVTISNITTSFKDGRVLCAIIHHYRPDLLDYGAINPNEPAKNNQIAFDILEKELGIPPVMSGTEMAQIDTPDFLTQLSYLTQIYDTFRCEIPHIKHPKLDLPDPKRAENDIKLRVTPDVFLHDPEHVNRPPSRHKRSTDAFASKMLLNQGDRKPRKRKTMEKIGASVEERQKRYEEIVANRVDRHNKRRQQRRMQTEQFLKSMQMLQSNCKPDHSEPFEDYSIYLYRQTAPNFEDRVKNLEKQFVYVPDRENRLPSSLAKRETDEDFAARIKDMEQKWQDTQSVDKKPKDLLRAIGKIETSDWNIREIEKKIHENKMGKSVNKDKERVPKWSKEQFSARLTKMEKQHLDRQNSSEVKYAEIDKNIKQLDLKLKEGSALDLNQQKVASLTEKLTGKNEPVNPPKVQPIQKSNSKTAVVPSQNSEFCHFCQKRVYLMERLSAEGRFFHRGCFRCQYCQSVLRLGSYMFDREGIHGYRFYCTQHFGMPGELRGPKIEQKKVVPNQEGVSGKQSITGVLGLDLLDRVQTPERVEFANLSSGHISSDHEESPSPIDEDEWTDRNFRNSIIDSDSTDDSSSSSDTDSDDEEYEEALEEPITKEGNMKWAERYKKRYSHKYHDIYAENYSSSDHFSYDENSSGEDDSDTATEGEEEIRARELRKQEVRVEPPVPDTGTDTEIASCESSSESSSEIQNSATEISTDSEFAHDEPTPTREAPKKMFDQFVTKTRGSGLPKKVQVKSSVLQGPTNNNGRAQKSKDIELKFTPLIPSPVIRKPPPISLFAKNEGYSLNRTQSTGGIATKVSLELKKKYLLGEVNTAGNIQKSGSASTLDSKFKSFHTNISDCQKLLKPAPEISASMQVFCNRLNERTSPLSPIFGGPNIFGKDKTSPTVELKSPSLNGLLEITKCASTSCVPETKSSLDEEILKVNETEGRPRSPVHEKSIIVPVIDWEKNKKDKEKYVDSLSSTDSELDVNITSKSTVNNIPRLEVHDDSGAILNEEFDSLNVVDVNRKLDVPKSINGEKKTLNQPKILPEMNDSILPEQHSALHVKEKLEKEDKEESKSLKSGRSSPSTEDINQAALTETELSDWARDGMGSDDLEDVDFEMSPKTKDKFVKKVKIEHVCAKNKEKKQPVTECVNILNLNIENIEFMDTGTESSDDNAPTQNNGYVQFHNDDEFLEDSLSPVILVNNIVETANPVVITSLVDNEINKDVDEEINEGKNGIEEDKNDDSLVVVETGTTTEENTCSDSTVKVVTEKNENIEIETIKESNEDEVIDIKADSKPEITPVLTELETPTNLENKLPSLEFDEHCQRLQSKIEFSNARDSIDIRKTRRKSKPDVIKPDLIQEEKKISSSQIVLPIITTLYKKEEIEKERNLNQKLVQEMVMNKMKAQNKSLERKKRSRNSFSPIRPFELTKSATTEITSQVTPDVLLSTINPLQKSQSNIYKKELSTTDKLPDVSQINNEFKTPKAPPRTKCDEAKRTAEKFKQDARARVRLLSDEDLGLSPEDKLVKLRQKTCKKLKDNETVDIHIQDSIESLVINRERRNSLLYNNDTLKRNTSFRRSKSGGEVTQSSVDLTLKLSPVRPNVELSLPMRTKSVSEINRPLALKPVEIKNTGNTSFCKSDPNLLTDQKKEKKSKDRERRKSITKFITDMFTKKKDNAGTSPPSQSKGFLSRISPKSKTKSKSLYALDLEDLDKLVISPLRRNSISEVNLRRSVEENIPPPIPPLPKNYTGMKDESSDGELDLRKDLSSCDALDQSGITEESSFGRRPNRSGRKTARQAQLKRHRMAQEIQRKLEETEVKTRELELRGVMVEKALRGETNDTDDLTRDEADLLKEWFDLMRERTDLGRYEKELMIRAQELELEDRHARLQHDLRERLERAEPKSKEEVEIEGSIIKEMMEIVAKRDSLISVLEEDRLRHCEEDRDFEEKMLAKGIHLTPLLKTCNK
ncbi:protein-methionine sulfoxide oxidase mical3a isoform X9 [Onthophagus taurus]|uniref:protein-methionine sulfoxide oxidase mical3a isoform X9 n=1 Tax=Onthophagus taurus TaxID=166361 RepID=UPI0039BE8E38